MNQITNDELDTLAKVARLLPGEWVAVSMTTFCVHLAHAGGETLSVYRTYSTKPGMVEISHHIPGHLRDVRPYDFTIANIRVNLSRTPEALARDISKRLLPATEEAHSVLMRAWDARNSYENEVAATSRLVGEALGDVGCLRANKKWSFDLEEGYGDVVCYSKTVNIEISSVPVDLALKILRTIAEG